MCGGIAEYFDVDPTWVRLLWALCVLAGGVGLLAYILAWVIIPANPSQKGSAGDIGEVARMAARKGREMRKEERGNGMLIAGIIVLGIGLVFLATNFGWLGGWDWKKTWPVFLVIVGIGLLARWVAYRG